MRTHKLLLALIPILLAPCAGRAEWFRVGYPVCESKQKLQEFLALARSSSKKDQDQITEYVVKQWCVYPKAQSIKLRLMDTDGTALILFPDSGTEAWTSIKAISRREQPPLTNIIIEDPDHPDSANVCRRISTYTRAPSARTLAIAEDVMRVNSVLVGAAAPAYVRALQQQGYDLVTDWHEGQCVAELDVPGQQLIACSIAELKYWQCRHNRKDEAELCYRDLCTGGMPSGDD